DAFGACARSSGLRRGCVRVSARARNPPERLVMTSASRGKARDQLRALEAASGDSPLRDDLHALGDAISVGDISDAMGVAIGRNIRQVVNHFDVPPEAAGALLDLRAMLGTAL